MSAAIRFAHNGTLSHDSIGWLPTCRTKSWMDPFFRTLRDCVFLLSERNTDLRSLFSLVLPQWQKKKKSLRMTDTSLNPLGAYAPREGKKIQICKHVWYRQTLLVLCEGYKFRNGVWESKEELGFPLETGDRPHRGGDLKEASI